MTIYDRRAIQEWLEDDPDPVTTEEIKGLLAAADAGNDVAQKELADRFRGPLRFGTAGLRGALGGGPHRMNRAVVLRTAAGLTRFLQSSLPRGFTMVIGYDARHGSREFAVDTAAVAEAAGGTVHLFAMPVPTPVVAFALRDLQSDAAVVVTASHNPRQDNGYKVYLGGNLTSKEGRGAQIVAPVDEQIFEEALAVTSIASIPRAAEGWDWLGEEMVSRYLRRITEIVRPGPRTLRLVTTALHGVAGKTLTDALRSVGFTDIHVVAEQQDPHPDFPTVDFPNPEEVGTLDLALTLAKSVDADLVLANDPDGDRCAAMIPAGRDRQVWRQLSGNEVGALLGEQAAREHSGSTDSTLANSLVSSRLLQKIAEKHGVSYRCTLTGFKWIVRVPGLVYGFEEALGYCVDPAFVRDKDGISAAVKLAVLASEQKAAGRGLQDLLDDQDREYGCHMSAPLTFRLRNDSQISRALANLSRANLQYLAGSPVTYTADLAEGYRGLPPTEGILFLTAADDQVVVRRSGTEPKLKAYLEVVIPITNDNLENAHRLGTARIRTLKAQLREALDL